VKNFGENGHSNEDISKIESKNIPEHDLLCGGFPCFTAGHKVKTIHGYKNIEDIKTDE